MRPARLDLRPLSGGAWETSATGPSVFAKGVGPTVLRWTPDQAKLRSLAEIRTLRIDLGLTALDGLPPDIFVEADWGGGYGAASRARLKTGDKGLFAVLPARGRRLHGLRLLLVTQEARRLAVDHFSVTGNGKLDPDPRGRLGPVLESLKGTLGPLRAPMMDVWRLARRARFRGVALRGGQDRWRATYNRALGIARNPKGPHFAAPIVEPLRLAPDAPKIVAFYLPQFHPIAENDAWWGKGFTDWSNVAKAQPQFVGHDQPRLPADLGYYDLRVPAVMAQQIALAKTAGVAAFCFHYYWFAGKRLLEAPIEAYLADPSLDLPFALCWANENWTRRWEGDESLVLIAQDHSPEDDKAVFHDLARYLADPRYLRIGGRPVLVVYRPELLPDAKATTDRWRALSLELGLGELVLYATTAFGFSDYAACGFDGIVDFPPHGIDVAEITREIELLNPSFEGQVYDYARVADAKLNALATADPGLVPGVMPSWDNQARKSGAGKVFHGADPAVYQRWLGGALDHAARTRSPGEALVFVNAWNEWAEGAYLEPDRRFGHAYLHATRAALAPYVPRLTDHHPLAAAAATRFQRRSGVAILLHLYYPELTVWFAQRLASLAERADVILTVPESWAEAELAAARAAFPEALILITPNQGRDIGPFIRALKVAREHGYELFCKLHTKRSPHQNDGDAWRETLVAALVGQTGLERALNAFEQDPRLGLLAGSASRTALGKPDVMTNNAVHVQRLAQLMALTFNDDTPFAAGSMFWGRTEAFAPLAQLSDDEIAFGPELGRVDGTTAHAIERLTVAIAQRAGYRASFQL